MITNSVGNKSRHKFDSNGKMLTGIQYEEQGVFYLNEDKTSPSYGALVTGWVMIDGEYFYFDNMGRLVVNGVTPDGYIVDANGARVGLANTISAFTGTMNTLEKAVPLTYVQNFMLYMQALRIQKQLELQQMQQAQLMQQVQQ